MQPARFKLHAEERTCNPVQRPNFRGRVTKKEPQKTISPRGLESPAREDRIERNIKVAVLPPILISRQGVVAPAAAGISGFGPVWKCQDREGASAENLNYQNWINRRVLIFPRTRGLSYI